MQAAASASSGISETTPLIKPPEGSRKRRLVQFGTVSLELEEYTPNSRSFTKDLENDLQQDPDAGISLLPITPAVTTEMQTLYIYEDWEIQSRWPSLREELFLSMIGSMVGSMGGLFAGYVTSHKFGSKVYISSILSAIGAAGVASLVGRVFRKSYPKYLGRAFFGGLGAGSLAFSLTAGTSSFFRGHLFRYGVLPIMVTGGAGIGCALLSLFNRHVAHLFLTSGTGSLVGLGIGAGVQAGLGNATVDSLIGSIAGALVGPYAFYFTDI